jgi:NAD(P)-dependent dehydrogenase (short-subunit alcohol dehydrogenase family)
MGSSTSFLKRFPPAKTGQELIVVTGANSGIGLEACIMFANKGYRVAMVCRNKEKAEAARMDAINRGKIADESKLITVICDVSDLESVKTIREKLTEAVQAQREELTSIEVLLLNAGVMALSTRQESKQGSELQMATNCYGHFLMTSLLIDLVAKAKTGRGVIVSTSSGAHKSGPRHVPVSDIDYKQPGAYQPFPVYGMSKLGNILFTKCLARLLEENHINNVVTVACHPGITRTPLFRSSNAASWIGYFGQSIPMGALPLLLASLDGKSKNGDYCGPFFFDWVGQPTWNRAISSAGLDKHEQDVFWEVCENKTHADLKSKIKGLSV